MGSFDFLMKISTTYDLSVDWLLYGKGQAHLIPPDHYLNQLQDFHIELIEMLIEYPEEKQREILRNIISLLQTK